LLHEKRKGKGKNLKIRRGRAMYEARGMEDEWMEKVGKGIKGGGGEQHQTIFFLFSFNK